MERMTYFENGRWYLKDGSVVCPIPATTQCCVLGSKNLLLTKTQNCLRQKQADLTGIISKAKSNRLLVAITSPHFAKTTTSFLCGSSCGTSTVKTMCASYSKRLGRCEIC